MPAISFKGLLNQSGAKISAEQKQSVDWFRKMALGVQKVDTRNLIDTSQPFKRMVKISETSIGKMYMFTYDPKMKQKLPYYDIYPLIFPVEYYNDSFLGINLHYLPPLARASLMDALSELLNNDKKDKTTKLRISYNILKGSTKFDYFKPCVKKYLFAHVRSNFLYVAPDEWNIALMLPTQKFVKAGSMGEQSVSTTQVYRESMRNV